jgi:hypothetical protein
MSRLRRVLGPIVAVWLLCQAGGAVSAWIAAVDDCGCPHDASGMCPMHNSGAKRGKTCAMRAADSSAALTIASLLGPVAPMPAPSASVPVIVAGRAFVVDSTADGLRPVPPDPPPPRA